MSGFIPSTVPEYFNVVDLQLDRWIREGLSNKTVLIDLKSNESVTYSELYTLTCSRRTFIGNWYNTKDMMYFDREGYLYFVGRCDDMFKVHGLWVSPVEVENLILATGLVKECAVVGVQSKDGLIEAVAFVVPKEVRGADLENRLKEELSNRLPTFKMPKRIIELEDIPKTATGKIKRTELRELANRILRGIW